MKNKTLPPLIVAVILILSACAIFAFMAAAGVRTWFKINSSSGGQVEPVIGTNSTDDHPITEAYEIEVGQVEIDRVEVEFGFGSPRPVHVVVSGSLPDTCSQLEFGSLDQDGTVFSINLSAVISQEEGCLQDAIPIKTRIPLNVIYLPEGEYSVLVNGVRADFTYQNGTSTGLLWTADHAILKEEIEVVQLETEVGVGSPIPVSVLVSGDLPSTCAQLGEIWIRQEGSTFFIRLISSTPEGADCAQNTLPFWLEVPLNIVSLPGGRYEVEVNGETTSFELPLP